LRWLKRKSTGSLKNTFTCWGDLGIDCDCEGLLFITNACPKDV